MFFFTVCMQILNWKKKRKSSENYDGFLEWNNVIMGNVFINYICKFFPYSLDYYKLSKFS